MKKSQEKSIEELRTVIETSNLFDKRFYLMSNRDVRVSGISSIKHYSKYGIKEDRKPNKDFDPVWYREYYLDIKKKGEYPFLHYILFGKEENRFMNEQEKNEYEKLQNQNFDINFYKNNYEDLKIIEDENFDFLLHYIRYGKKENRKKRNIKAQIIEEEIIKKNSYFIENLDYLEDEKIILNSGLFNKTYYLDSYEDVKLSQQNPLKHFCKYGWKDNRNPNNDFNTKYYKEKYPDISNSGMNPFIHWLKYGKIENRVINYIEIDPHEHEQINTPSIIFISHEASQTGAPAVLLTLMKWIKENTNINFSIIVGAQGPWNNRFEELAPTFYMDRNIVNFEYALKQFCGNHVQAVYINTIASALYAEQLQFLHATFYTHVHEMENLFEVFSPHVEVLKQICSKYIAVSQGSIDAINKRFDSKKIDLKFLKPFIDPISDRKAIDMQEVSSKKIIFGCGAVEMRKGFDIFCEVAAQLKKENKSNFMMYWIGLDIDKDLVASEVIQKYNVSDVVIFLGTKDYPRDYFKNGDIFLLTSREDPYPLVCMEAAECDMPIICFDEKAGGMHSFVEKDAGIVVPYLDVSVYTNAVIKLLDDDSLREKFGKIAHQKVIDRHYVDVIAPKILDFLPKSVKINSDSENELINYIQLIDQSKVISFDIFDTLITRRISDPSIAFDIMEYKHTSKEAAPLALFHERMNSAGKVLSSYNGKVDDINIDEIYESMSFYKNSSIEKETEIQICVTHPLGKKIYDYAKQQGKTICITSDMYLDEETIKTILLNNGYNHWDEFYLSSQRGMKKDTGKLFNQLKKDYAKKSILPHEILHIGDNWIGDIKFAREAGFNAIRFTPLYEKNSKIVDLEEKEKNQLSQIGKIWESFSKQLTKLWNESKPEMAKDIFTKLGFELTGPLSVMMALHSKTLAEQYGIKKIIFMARDGRIIKKAFDEIYKDEIVNNTFESLYLHLSRATVIPATFENPLTSNDIYFLIEGLHLSQKPISYFIEKANLNISEKSIQKVIKKYFKSSEYIPSWEDLNTLSKMFIELSDNIYNANEKNRLALEEYLNTYKVFDEEKVLVVDVGWLLNIQSRLDNFLKKFNKSTSIIGSYVGSRDRINKSLAHSSLLFDCGDPSYYSRFLEENVTLFELLFSSAEASAKSLSLETDNFVTFKPFEKSLPSQEFMIAQKLHFGAEEYIKYFNDAKKEFFPEQISKDYFFQIFKSLVNTKSEGLRTVLNNFEIKLGGHHDLTSNEQLIKHNSNIEFRIKPKDEYFKPMYFNIEDTLRAVLIVTSAGLDNGSTRYRAIHLADSLKNNNISSVLIHASTPKEVFLDVAKGIEIIIFQRCFEEQGNVGNFLSYAKENNIRCIAEIDDLVFPKFVPTIGSVKGGEWNIDEAMFVANSYEIFIKKMDKCIVSTPSIKEYIEKEYNIKSEIFRNKVTKKRLIPYTPINQNIKLVYASGTYSHKEDFDIIEDILYNFFLKNKEVSLSILGSAQVSERLLSLENVRSYPLLPYGAMLDFISQHHLMLVPLADDIFNQAKSNVKFVECGAVAVPVLASNVGEFKLFIEDGKNGFLASNKEEWIDKLNYIAENPTILNEIGQNANNTIKENFSTKNLEEEIIKIIQG